MAVSFLALPLPPKIFWYSFLLQVESTPEPSTAVRIKKMEKFNNLIEN
jgi:hypothetical protein